MCVSIEILWVKKCHNLVFMWGKYFPITEYFPRAKIWNYFCSSTAFNKMIRGHIIQDLFHQLVGKYLPQRRRVR